VNATEIQVASRRGATPATQVPERALVVAARGAALPAGIATFFLSAHAPFWVPRFMNTVAIPAARTLLPAGVGRPLLLGFLLAAPFLGALMIYAAVRSSIRRSARCSVAEGRAAAAGACMATAAVGVSVILVDQLLVFTSLSNFGAELVGAFLGLGMVGAFLFAEVRRASGEGGFPALYAPLAAAGVAAPLLCWIWAAAVAMGISLPPFGPLWIASAVVLAGLGVAAQAARRSRRPGQPRLQSVTDAGSGSMVAPERSGTSIPPS
jgi:hypothetical protein